MILTGTEILRQANKGRIIIDPFREDRLNPNSYNLSLAPEIKFFTKPKAVIDCKEKPDMESDVISRLGYILQPGILYLAKTVESTETDYFVPAIEGRSSWGRLGLSIHVTAGFGDVGFSGQWTLEMTVVHPLKIYAGVQICQIYFIEPKGKRNLTYRSGGKYAGQRDVGESRIWQELR